MQRGSQGSDLTCPSCGEDAGSTLACLSCGQILLGADRGDHFQRLGLDAAQPYDPQLAETRYLKLSRALHPDFQSAADDETRARALRHSALLNEAYRVLSDEQLRAEHLLELHDPGALERHKQLSPAFLMEAMEVSEELEQAQATGCHETVERIARETRRQIEERMRGVSAACIETIRRIAAEDHEDDASSDAERIATLLHQARVYRRILRDTESARR